MNTITIKLGKAEATKLVEFLSTYEKLCKAVSVPERAIIGLATTIKYIKGCIKKGV